MIELTAEEVKTQFLTSKEMLAQYPDVTYRQLDHWIRRGMVSPTHVTQSALEHNNRVIVFDYVGAGGSGRTLLWDVNSPECKEARTLLELVNNGVEVGLAYKLMVAIRRNSANAQNWRLFFALYEALKKIYEPK
jgi:hypothetical protein